MNLVNLLNPSHEHKFEVALFKLAQRNMSVEFISPIVMPLVIYIAFGSTLDPKGFNLWIALLLGPFCMGIFVHFAMRGWNKSIEPSVSQLRKWRNISTVYFITAAFGWGGIGFLFDGIHTNQNNAMFVTYLAVVTIGGNVGGIHSFRMYYITVALSMIVVMATLPNAYGAEALPMSIIMAVYPVFLARTSLNSQATILKMIELQIENEQLLKEKAIAAQVAERERIYRDLHDDVGAKLLGLAISAQRAELPREADMARSALQDLRDVVSRSAQPLTALGELVADWRAETEQRLQPLGVTLEWRISEQDMPMPVSAEAALHLSRILREAITNVLRHARQANRIVVNTALEQDCLNLSIEDNGPGLPQTGAKPHRGMNSMNARADVLGASLTWQAAEPHGCRVALKMPLANLAVIANQ